MSYRELPEELPECNTKTISDTRAFLIGIWNIIVAYSIYPLLLLFGGLACIFIYPIRQIQYIKYNAIRIGLETYGIKTEREMHLFGDDALPNIYEFIIGILRKDINPEVLIGLVIASNTLTLFIGLPFLLFLIKVIVFAP